jgi:hypothetical protein
MLIQFQSGLPVTSRSGAILKTTVVREKWELNNDDIELVIVNIQLMKLITTMGEYYFLNTKSLLKCLEIITCLSY